MWINFIGNYENVLWNVLFQPFYMVFFRNVSIFVRFWKIVWSFCYFLFRKWRLYEMCAFFKISIFSWSIKNIFFFNSTDNVRPLLFCSISNLLRGGNWFRGLIHESWNVQMQTSVYAHHQRICDVQMDLGHVVDAKHLLMLRMLEDHMLAHCTR